MSANGAGIVIAGGGLAGQRCAETLRRFGYDGAIRIVGDEPVAPYDRPPLSKGLLAGEIDEQALAYRPPRWYCEQDVELLLGRRALALDPASRVVRTADGEEIRYSDVLIATGSTPRRLPAAEDFDNVHLLRSVADAAALRPVLRQGARLVIVGAGFIGMEVAATARSLGVDVTIVEAAATPLAALLGADQGRWFAELHREEGTRVLLSTTVSRFRGGDSVGEVELSDGQRLRCDAVVIGIGVRPATSWLVSAGFPPDGVPVGPGGRTALPHVYAAGDAAMPFDEGLRAHVRSEHWEAAARGGVEAARAMLGLEPGRASLSSFWSDQYGLRIQHVGRTQGADQVEIDGIPAERDFAVVYWREGLPIGALLVGRPRALPELRRLIATSVPAHCERLVS